MLTLKHRAGLLLSPSLFQHADQNVQSIPYPASALAIPQDQYILRMLVMSPDSNSLQLPHELVWLLPVIERCMVEQSRIGQWHPYVYVTVRSGVVRSLADDEWHVDGFSMRVPHAPEQNYVWTNCWPTEHLNQKFAIPEDFDPMCHNIHNYFQSNADESNIRQLECDTLYQIDPYVVHRRPSVPAGTHRTFFRISFVPVEIENDANTPNPLMPRRVYGRTDIRKTLTRYVP